MPLPPTHRYDHEPIYIHPEDKAWDYDRHNLDLDRIAAAAAATEESPAPPCEWPTEEDHPIYRYQAGRSRYDIETIRPWLKPGIEPVLFRLRRLSYDQYIEVEQMRERNQIVLSLDKCLRYGLRTVEGRPEIRWTHREGRAALPLTTEQCEELVRHTSSGTARAISCAVWVVSQTTYDYEKKA